MNTVTVMAASKRGLLGVCRLLAANVSGLSEGSTPFEHADDEAVSFQRRHQLARMLTAAGLDGDVEFGALGHHAADQPLMLDPDDVCTGLAAHAGAPAA